MTRSDVTIKLWKACEPERNTPGAKAQSAKRRNAALKRRSSTRLQLFDPTAALPHCSSSTKLQVLMASRRLRASTHTGVAGEPWFLSGKVRTTTSPRSESRVGLRLRALDWFVPDLVSG